MFDERGVGVKWILFTTLLYLLLYYIYYNIIFTTAKKSNTKNILSCFVQFKNKHVMFVINNEMTPEDRKQRVYI